MHETRKLNSFQWAAKGFEFMGQLMNYGLNSMSSVYGFWLMCTHFEQGCALSHKRACVSDVITGKAQHEAEKDKQLFRQSVSTKLWLLSHKCDKYYGILWTEQWFKGIGLI